MARSAELKERALRRRASAVVGDLWDAWSTRERRRPCRGARRRASARTPLRTRGDPRRARRRRHRRPPRGVARCRTPPRGRRDLELVFIGRDPETAAHDPVLARYRVDRAVAAIAPALTARPLRHRARGRPPTGPARASRLAPWSAPRHGARLPTRPACSRRSRRPPWPRSSSSCSRCPSLRPPPRPPRAFSASSARSDRPRIMMGATFPGHDVPASPVAACAGRAPHAGHPRARRDPRRSRGRSR